MLITGQDLCHRLGSSTYIKNAYTSYSLLPTGTSPISRACTHDNSFITCSDNSGTQHERFVQICASLCSFKRGSLLMLILRQLFDIGWEAAIYKTYTPPAGGRLTYQSDRHACVCCCHIYRLRQRSDISDSHSFARRCLSI